MTTRPTLTVAIVAQDEERNLAELLPALNWADEVVVIDGGSRDGTVATARRLGCRVVERRFDHFAAQRNHALRNARGEWVLMLDADERPTPQFIRELRLAIRQKSAVAYRVPIKSRIFGRLFRYSGTQDDRPIRLVRRDAAHWVREVHEICQVRGRIGRLSHGFTHTTLPDVATFLTKMHRYARLAAESRVRGGVRPCGGETWLGPPRELFRRLIWKLGLLDGPAGWTFCLLSALSVWVGAREHRSQWRARRATAPGELAAEGGLA